MATNNPNATLAHLRAEATKRFQRDCERRGVRVIQEGAGRWAARTDQYPDLVEHGETPEEAQQRLLEAIWWEESSWRDHVDPETAAYLDFQDD